MPHIPRRMPPSTGIDPSRSYPPRATQRPVPIMPPTEERTAEEKKKLRVGLNKISPHTFEPDVATLHRLLLGKEPDNYDDLSRLVPAPGHANDPATNRPGG